MPIVQSANGKSKSSNLCRSPRARPSHVAFYQEDGPFRIVMSAIPPYRPTPWCGLPGQTWAWILGGPIAGGELVWPRPALG